MENLLQNLSERLAIWQIIRAHSERDTVAIRAINGKGVSWRELSVFLDAVGHELNDLGIGRGNRVALVLPNGPEMAIALLTLASYTTVAPLNNRSTAAEFRFAFSDLRIDAVITCEGDNCAAEAVAHEIEVPSYKLRPDNVDSGRPFSLEGIPLATHADACLARPTDTAFVLHTSGTTGKPKTVPLVHERVIITAQNISRTLKLSDRDISLNVMPLFHVHGIINVLLSSCIVGAQVVCDVDFNPVTFLESLNKTSATWYSAVPTIHQSVLARVARGRGANGCENLRFIRSSSAPLHIAVLTQLEEAFAVPVIESYGMTEVDQIACNPLPPFPRKPGSVGPSGGPEIRIVDESFRSLPGGSTGQVAVRGPNVMPGYDNCAGDDSSFAGDFFLTGDIGKIDEDGYLFLLGRSKEIIIRGGEKISPFEVENCLISYPGISAAACFGVPHRFLGEVVLAAIVKCEGVSLSPERIRDFLRERLSAHKVPSEIYVLDSLPVGPTGKVVRRQLTERYSGFADAMDTPDKSRVISDLEQALIRIWEDVLGIRPVGIHEDFWDLGGSSLLATQLFGRMEQIFGKPIPVSVALEARNIATMAERLRKYGWTDEV